jgi:hypothetical protein
MSLRGALLVPIIVVALAAVGLLLLMSFPSSPPKEPKIEAPPAPSATKLRVGKDPDCDDNPNCEVDWLFPKSDHEGPSGHSDTRSRDEVIATMAKIGPRVQRCGSKRVQNVTIVVQVTVTPSGRVAKAEPTGEKAHTPEAQCVARAIRGARFPKSKHTDTIMFPFWLRERADEAGSQALPVKPEWGTVGILVVDETGAPLRADVIFDGKRIGTTKGTALPTAFGLRTSVNGRKLTMRARGFEPFEKAAHVIPDGYAEIDVYLTRIGK